MIVLRFNQSPRHSAILDAGRGREKEVDFPTLQRFWLCATCHGPLAVRVDQDGATRAHCVAGCSDDFVPVAWVEEEQGAQAEAIENLPPDLRERVRGGGRKPAAPNFEIFSLEKGEL